MGQKESRKLEKKDSTVTPTGGWNVLSIVTGPEKSGGGENCLYKDDSSCNQVFLGGYGAGSHSHLSEKHFGDLIIAFAH